MSEQIKKLYKRTEDALKRNNYDLAIEMLQNHILRYSPDDVKARKLLRATVKRKHQANGAPTKAQAISKGLGAQAKMKFAQMRKKWKIVIQEAENYLLNDPENVGVLYTLGEACVNAGHLQTAIFVFEDIYSINKEHIKTLVKLSEIYSSDETSRDIKNYDRAISLLQIAKKLSPSDGNISRDINRIAARKTTDIYANAKDSNSLKKDANEANILERLNKAIRTKEDALEVIAIIEAQLEGDPENKKYLRELSNKYLELAKFDLSGYDKAIEMLTKYLELDPTNFDTKNKITNCRVGKLKKQIDIIKEKLKKTPQDASLSQKLKQLQKNKIIVEIKEYSELVKERPTDADLRFILGKAMFMNKQFEESIANFQQTIQSPQLKVEAFNYMGQAFLKKKNYSLAETQFKKALEGLSANNKAYKILMYSLGLVYEAAGKNSDAVKIYTSLVEIDIQYKDVSSRLEKLKS